MAPHRLYEHSANWWGVSRGSSILIPGVVDEVCGDIAYLLGEESTLAFAVTHH